MMHLEKDIEKTIFASRWLLAPLYLGLVFTLFALMLKFFQKFTIMIFKFWDAETTDFILLILGLVDVVLIANLLLMIVFSGYENFVSKIDTVEGHVDRPEWMGKIDYSALKIKVLGSIVAISSIDLLKAFFSIHTMDKNDVAWMVGIHLTFVVSGVLFAVMEKVSHSSHTANVPKIIPHSDH